MLKKTFLCLSLMTLLLLSGCFGKQIVYRTTVVTIPEHYFDHCVDHPVDETGVVDYQTGFYAVSEAKIMTSKNIAKCNDRLTAGKSLQRRLVEKAKEGDSK